MAIESSSVVVRTVGVMATAVDRELVILNLSGNNYVSLDPIGRRVWELLETAASVRDLCHRLSLEFAATEDQIGADLVPFLTELERDGLVRVVA